MKYRIALLLKEHYRKQVKEWKKILPGDMQLTFIPYETLEELKDSFLSVYKEYDGFYVSGIIPYQVLTTLKEVRDMESLIVYSPIDVENTYSILLQQLILTGTKNLSRIGIDFLKKDENLEEMILSGRFAEAVHSYEARWESRDTLAAIREEEEFINQKYVEQCSRGKYDLVITYFYSVVETLRESDVVCRYVYPNPQAFTRIMENLRKNISLKNLKNNLSAVIHIDMGNQENVKAAVRDFNNQYFNKMIWKEYDGVLELYTDYDFLKYITEDFSCCRITKFLQGRMDFTGVVGYGVGANIYQARINAIDASRYGRNQEQKGISFLIDEKENLSVLGAESREEVLRVREGYVSEIANQVKLSAETILKIIGVMQTSGTDELTSEDLQKALDISLRTANKFLSALERSGYAVVTGKKRSGNKGRPVNVYQIKMYKKASREQI